MISNKKYAPTLRAKKGELGSLRVLPIKFSDSLLPIFVIPPKHEMKDEQPKFLETPDTLEFSKVLLPDWRDRPVIIDASHVFDTLSEETCTTWLPEAFSRARRNGLQPIPCVPFADLEGTKGDAYSLAIDRQSKVKVVLKLHSDDVEDIDVLNDLKKAVLSLNLSPEDCVILVDFTSSDLSLSEAPDVVIRTLDDLCQEGKWGGVIVQGSSYPIKYPIKENESCLIPRDEIQLWSKIHDDIQQLSSPIIFGDFAADHSKIKFMKSNGGVKPFRALRYATEDSWYVIRGSQKGKTAIEIQNICKDICELASFSGAGFSPADNWIKEASLSSSSNGGASQWRQHNTTRHIMITLKTLFTLDGENFDQVSVPQYEDKQMSMFE